MSFIFALPQIHFFQTTISASYFTPQHLASLSVFFEVYYIVMKQYGPNFIRPNYPFKANKISHIARHVAIKNKVLRLSHINLISSDSAAVFQADYCANYLTEDCTVIAN